MKFIHLSDLHLGISLAGISLYDDQKHILDQIVETVKQEKPDGVIIAGDIYDKLLPPTEAVRLFDDFLVKLSRLGVHIFSISGNHDSAERLAFGGRLMEEAKVHVAPIYSGNISPTTLKDRYGEVNVYLLPFIKPVHVRLALDDKSILSYQDAVTRAVANIKLDKSKRNVIVTHQFIAGCERSESERITVGNTDRIEANVFDGFDYVALGHIHMPYDVVPNKIRYCGTPLKYSFSEAHHKKSVTVVELNGKNNVSVRTVPLKPLHDMKEIRGTYAEVTAIGYYKQYENDYVRITLTDENVIPGAVDGLRACYPNYVKMRYDNSVTKNSHTVSSVDLTKKKSELELFSDFFTERNSRPLSETEHKYIEKLIEKLKESI